MAEENGSVRRRAKVLSPETKWEIFLQITSGEITQADAARKWMVDVSTVTGIRRTVKDAALAALAAKPGRPAKERDWALEAARSEIAPLTEAIKAQAIELAVVQGKSRPGADRPAPGESPRRGEGAGAQAGRRGGGDGFSQAWVASLWGVSDDRVHHRRQRLQETGTLIDKAPGGHPAWTTFPVLGGVPSPSSTWSAKASRSRQEAARRLARASGTTLREADKAIGTAEKMAGQPGLEAAARSGRLSRAQAGIVSGAAGANPAALRALLDLAATGTLSELAGEAARAEAAASSPEDMRREVRERRALRSYTDASGTWHLHAEALPEDGAKVMAALQPLADELFEEARGQGRREPPRGLRLRRPGPPGHLGRGRAPAGRGRLPGGPGGLLPGQTPLRPPRRPRHPRFGTDGDEEEGGSAPGDAGGPPGGYRC